MQVQERDNKKEQTNEMAVGCFYDRLCFAVLVTAVVLNYLVAFWHFFFRCIVGRKSRNHSDSVHVKIYATALRKTKMQLLRRRHFRLFLLGAAGVFDAVVKLLFEFLSCN